MSAETHVGVWIPFTGKRELHVYEDMLLDYVSAEHQMRHAVLFLGQHGGDPYRRFGSERTVTLRSDPLPHGGPVFTYYPDDRVLAAAIARARGTVLAVLSSSRPEADGWAAAVEAHNLLTGEPTPTVDDETAGHIDDLVDAGYGGGYNKRDNYIMSKVRPALTALLAQGCSNDFIVTYCLAKGLTATHAKDLRGLLPD